MNFVLASASPRRKELFEKIAENFEIDAARGEERADKSLPPAEYAETLARHKAEEVAAKKEHAGKIVLGADTVVAIGGGILGKPKSEEEAKAMLRLLSGKEHSVFTGVCLIFPDGGKIVRHDETKVKFKPVTEEFIRDYVAGGSPMDKAGAYGIQDAGGMFVSAIDGDYYTVMGLPICAVSCALREKFGILPFEK